MVEFGLKSVVIRAVEDSFDFLVQIIVDWVLVLLFAEGDLAQNEQDLIIWKLGVAVTLGGAINICKVNSLSKPTTVGGRSFRWGNSETLGQNSSEVAKSWPMPKQFMVL